MEAGYRVEHWFSNEALGERYKYAEVCNYSWNNTVTTFYWPDNSFIRTENTVAIVRIKPKQTTTNEKNAQ